MAKADVKNLVEVPVDPLEALLGVDPEAEITDEVLIARLGAKFTVRAPKDEEFKQVKNRCNRDSGKGKNKTRFFDADKFTKLLVFTFTTNPDFNNPKLAAKYGGLSPEDVVTKALLPGEVEKVAEAILTLGGYADDEEDGSLMDQAKN